jgi:hypothetical protein
MGIDPSQFSGKFADSEFRGAESGALRRGARNLEPYSPGTDKADRSLQINACTETKSEDNV